jgi:hypothetical protein
MSNMKIISIMDAENRAQSAVIITEMQMMVSGALAGVKVEIEQLKARVKRIEEGGKSDPLND